MEKEKLLKVIIPICMVLVVVGIWKFKSGNPVTPENKEDYVLEATSIDLDALKKYNLPIIIDFGSDSCIPCKEMAPVLTTLNAKMQGKAIIKFVDVWKNEGAANDFPIQIIPSQVFINADGDPYVPMKDLQIEFEFYTDKNTGEHAFTVHKGGLTEDQMRRILADMGVDE